MGCDIHLYIEVKTENGWELYAHPNIKRNYSLFAKLANVRNENKHIIPIDNPRGLPKDISYLVKKEYEYMGSDVHSTSFISMNEIEELQKWINTTKLFGDSYLDNDLEHSILHTYLKGNCFYSKLPDWIFDVRFVFWFDN
jgi:hypothetical protein